jgi:hypothetical protein
MRKFIVAATLLGIGFGPAFAQTQMSPSETKPAGQERSQADCLANFKTADANGDGVLSLDEQSARPNIVPTQLALSGPITQAEFLTSCTANVPKGG